jgi:hypothetical protein
MLVMFVGGGKTGKRENGVRLQLVDSGKGAGSILDRVDSAITH